MSELKDIFGFLCLGLLGFVMFTSCTPVFILFLILFILIFFVAYAAGTNINIDEDEDDKLV